MRVPASYIAYALLVSANPIFDFILLVWRTCSQALVVVVVMFDRGLLLESLRAVMAYTFGKSPLRYV